MHMLCCIGNRFADRGASNLAVFVQVFKNNI